MARKIAGSARWTLAAMVARQAGRLGMSLLLARWLGPTEFGVVAALAIYTAFVGFFLEAGFSAGIVQKKDLRAQDVGATFWVAAASGLLIAVLTLLLAGDLAALLTVGAVATPLLVLSMSPLLKSLGVAPTGLLTRNLRLRYLGAAEIVATLVSVAGGLVAATVGFGYWAIVVQQLGADLLLVVMVWVAAPGVSFGVDGDALRRVRSFTGPIIVSQMLGYLTLNIDNALVARYLGTEALAFYSIAYRIMQLPVTLGGAAVLRVTFPLVSRSQSEPIQIRAIFLRSSRLISMIVCPVMLTLGALATPIMTTVFGESWLPAVPVLQVFCLCAILQAVANPVSSVLMGTGKSWLVLKWAAIPLLLAVVGFVAGLPWGVVGVAAGFTVSVVVSAVLLVRVATSLISLSPMRWISAVSRPLLAAVPGAALALVIRQYVSFGSDLLGVAALAAMSGAVFLLTVWFVDRAGLRELSRIAGMTRSGSAF